MNAQQKIMIETLLPTEAADNGSACTGCMQFNPRLVRCSACLRVKYCSKACQSKNWRQHKPVCRVLQNFRRASRSMADGMTHLPIAEGKYNLGDKFGRFREMATIPPRSSLLGDLPGNVPDLSWDMAKKLVMRSPCCSVCNRTEYDRELPVTEWRRCPRCHHGWCCAEHFEDYRRRHTAQICDAYVRASKIDLFRYNHTVNQGDRFQVMPERPMSAPFTTFPKSWDEYFRLRMPVEYGMRGNLPGEFFPSATFLLSQVNTCLHGMYQHDRDFFTTAEELTIHVVGPGQSFEYEGGSPTCVWEEIMHCLPSVGRMNVVFTGPEGKLTYPLTQIQCCPDCVSKGRVRMQGFHELTYHDYHASDDFVKPDFVVAFNTGMFEEYTASWKESLRVLLTLDVPCIFTSYNKHEGNADYEVLIEVNARTLTDKAVLNPFSVDIPLIDDGCIDKFFQHNMYYNCFRGRETNG